MTPLLVMVFGIHPAVAVGTDLLQVSITKAAGSLVHGFQNTIDWRIVRTLATGSIPATILTLVLLSRIDLHSPAAQGVITEVLGFSLIATAAALLARKRLAKISVRWTERLSDRQQALLTTASGALVGFLVTMTSVGAGAIGTTVRSCSIPACRCAPLSAPTSPTPCR